MNLGDYAETMAYDAAFWLAGTRATDTPLQELGALSLDVCTKLRSCAIVALLAQGNVDGFHHNLVRSGRTWLAFLERCRRENDNGQHHFVAGRFEPFLDACCAREWELATMLANRAPDQFCAGHEYEDDHCYARILGLLVSERRGTGECEQLLAQMLRYLAGDDSPRAALARALLDRSDQGFHDGIEKLIAARRNSIEAARARGQLEEPPTVAQRRVFVEGLAMLAIAEHLGLATQPEYSMCPSLARRLPSRPPPPE